MLKILKGVFLAAFAGCCWGSMAVAAQYLFTDCGFQARHLTTLRLIGAGVLLLALQAAFETFQGKAKHPGHIDLRCRCSFNSIHFLSSN